MRIAHGLAAGPKKPRHWHARVHWGEGLCHAVCIRCHKGRGHMVLHMALAARCIKSFACILGKKGGGNPNFPHTEGNPHEGPAKAREGQKHSMQATSARLRHKRAAARLVFCRS